MTSRSAVDPRTTRSKPNPWPGLLASSPVGCVQRPGLVGRRHATKEGRGAAPPAGTIGVRLHAVVATDPLIGLSRSLRRPRTMVLIAIATPHRPPRGDATMSRRPALWCISFLILSSAGTASSPAQGPTDAGAPSVPEGTAPVEAVRGGRGPDPVRADGLSLLRPHAAARSPSSSSTGCGEPVVLAADDRELEADPSLGGRYQFWTFGYSTGDPIPHSAALLRRDLDEVRHKVDPDSPIRLSTGWCSSATAWAACWPR